MTNLQDDYVKMFGRVEQTLTKNVLVWQNNAIVSGHVNLLRTFIHDIGELDEGKMVTAQGVTLNSGDLRKRITPDAFRVKEALKIYYGINAMDDEERLFIYPKSKIERMRKNDFYVTVMGIIDKASPLLQQLGPLGVTTLKLAAMTQDSTNFYKLIMQKNEENENQKGFTVGIATKVNQCRLMLRNKMDSVMVIFDESNPDLYFAYRGSRKLVRSGGKHNYYTVIISGKVTDAATKTPLAGVLVTPETKGKPTVTDSEGKYSVKMYKKNAKALVFSLEGYETVKHALPEGIKEHKMRVEVKMKKI